MPVFVILPEPATRFNSPALDMVPELTMLFMALRVKPRLELSGT